jgi:hypothetical protein
MPNGDEAAEYSVDDASRVFSSLERALGRRRTRTTRSREDANALRALFEAWFRTYRPLFVAALGEFPAIDAVDRDIRELRAQAGSQVMIAELRATLRRIARAIDREILPAYDAARWTSAAGPQTAGADTSSPLIERLERLSPDLATSYLQVQTDLADGSRRSFLGPAGEIREVMRAVIHVLAPDDEVRSRPWYRGHEGNPTQAERVRYILEERAGGDAPIEAAEVVDTKVARLGRLLYTRASRAFHVGAQRDEVDRIIGYVDAVLNEILPP